MSPKFQLARRNFRCGPPDGSTAPISGDNALGTPPPAGIRLRWNYPFFDLSPATRLSKPVSFEVQRSSPIDPKALWLPNPNAGHLPRTPVLKSLWRPLVRKSAILSVDGSACRSTDAIYFEMPAGASSVTVTLITTDGSGKVVGEVGGGDVFYFELADTKTVLFSDPCYVANIDGLFLSGTNEGNRHPI